jgi:hypothetical protein
MLGKLLLIIMAAGAIACALLVIRQQRIETFHEMTVTHRELLEHEASLWRLRCEIAARCRPSEVREAMKRLEGDWAAIPARPDPPLLSPQDDEPGVRVASYRSSPVASSALRKPGSE